jgi:hypothetical protein
MFRGVPKMNNTNTMVPLALLLGALLTTGCSSTPAFDARLGSCVNQAVTKEILDIGAQNRLTPAMGLEPGASMAVVARYNRSFASPPPPANVFAIGLGAAAGSSGMASTP